MSPLIQKIVTHVAIMAVVGLLTLLSNNADAFGIFGPTIGAASALLLTWIRKPVPVPTPAPAPVPGPEPLPSPKPNVGETPPAEKTSALIPDAEAWEAAKHAEFLNDLHEMRRIGHMAENAEVGDKILSRVDFLENLHAPKPAVFG